MIRTGVYRSYLWLFCFTFKMLSRDFFNKLLVLKPWFFFFWCLRYGQRQKRVKDTQAGSSPRCKAQDCALLEQADSRVASVDKKTLNHTRKFNRA